MKEIVGIIGFLGSGKNTVGDYMISELGFEQDSFAGPLKDCISMVFGWDRDLMEGSTPESRKWRDEPDEWWEAKLGWQNHRLNYLRKRFTPRLAMQLWGTDVIRTGFNDDIWILSLQNRLKQKDRVVITDCRFPNEIQSIRELGGKIIRVKRGPEPEWWDTAIAANSPTFTHANEATQGMDALGIHISEWAWIGTTFDAVIENDGTLLELEEKTKWTLQTLF